MGTGGSKVKVSHQQRYLMGNLGRKSELERKFYNLSYQCLGQESHKSINTEKYITENGMPALEMMGEDKADIGDHRLTVNREKPEVQNSDVTVKEIDQKLDKTLKLVSGNEPDSATTKHSIVDTQRKFVAIGENCFIGKELFVPILDVNSKKLICTQTYVCWRSIVQLERLRSLFSEKRTIYLVQVDDLPDFISNHELKLDSEEITLLNFTKKFLEAFFTGMHVKWMKPVSIAEKEWHITSRYHKKTGKFQYLVSDFFPLLQKICPKDGYCIMGLIWSDLYPKEELNFVLGEAFNDCKSGMVSFGRFEPSIYDADTHQDVTMVTADVVWKLLKCLSHELCHLFGMSHCDFFQCTMNSSGSVKAAMSQPLFLCPVCVRKLQHICKFDILQRYQNLEKLLQVANQEFPSEQWRTSLLWVQRCINYLTTTVTHL